MRFILSILIAFQCVVPVSPSKVLALTVGSDPLRLDPLLESARWAGMDIQVLSLGEQGWVSFISKWNALDSYLDLTTQDQNDIVLVLDGYDVLVSQPVENVIAVYQNRTKDCEGCLVFGVERVPLWSACWDDGTILNAGVVMGSRRWMHAFATRMIQASEHYPDESDDQILLNSVLCKSKHMRSHMVPDTSSTLVVGLEAGIEPMRWSDGRWCRWKEDPSACPPLIHGNGHAGMKRFCRSLDITAKTQDSSCFTDSWRVGGHSTRKQWLHILVSRLKYWMEGG